MAKAKRPLLEGIKAEVGGMAADLKDMVLLRWELARLELQSDARTLRGLAVCLAMAALAVLVSLPLLVAAGASALAIVALNEPIWLAIFGGSLLLGGLVGALLAWRYFRRRLTGLEQTLEELHEDVLWLREWAERSEKSDEAE
jgi:uncharacterized membrane protein YqjE